MKDLSLQNIDREEEISRDSRGKSRRVCEMQITDKWKEYKTAESRDYLKEGKKD